MYVEFMKNFLLVDSSELLAVWHIFASWAKKHLIPTLLDMMYVEFMKNFLLADPSELISFRIISASWAQNVWFLFSRHDVRRVHEKFSSRRFERADGC